MKTKLHVVNVTIPERRFPHAFFVLYHPVEAHLRKFLITSRSKDYPNEDTDELKHFWISASEI